MWNFKSRLYLKLQEENDFLRWKPQRVAQHSNGRSCGWTAARCLLSSDHLSNNSAHTKQSKRFEIRSTRSALWSAKCFFNEALYVNLNNKIKYWVHKLMINLMLLLTLTQPAPVMVAAVFQATSIQIVFLFVAGATQFTRIITFAGMRSGVWLTLFRRQRMQCQVFIQQIPESKPMTWKAHTIYI